MNKILKSSIYLVSANSVFALSQWLIMIVIIRILGVEYSGMYAAVLMIVAPVFLFFSFHLRHVASSVSNLKHEKFLRFFYFREISMASAILFTISIGYFLTLINNSVSTEYLVILIIFSIIKYFEGKSDILYGFFQNRGLINLYSLSVFIKGIAILILPTLVMYLAESLLYAALSLLVVYFLIYQLDKKNYEHSEGMIIKERSLKSKKSNNIILYSFFFMGVGAVADSLIINSQRYVILSEGSLESLGVYAPIVQLILIAQIIIASIGSVFIPRLSKYYGVNPPLFLKNCLVLMAIALILGLCLIFIFTNYSIELQVFFFGKDFRSPDDLLFSISVAGLFLYLSTATQYILISQKKYTASWMPSLLTFLVATPLTIYLFNISGLPGAGYALVISYFSKNILQLYWVFK
jgi:O-antigen/teichoic acid export membrane protein